MASTNIRDFYFYDQYVWQAVDFELLETSRRDEARGVFEGAFGKAVLTGLIATPGGGLNVDISAGIAVNASGRILVTDEVETATLASPVGNPARSLVVLRPMDTDTDYIDDPTNPSGPQVPLNALLGYEVVVINGTPAATPQYPATQSGDVILTGVKLSAGHVTITEADLELYPRDVPHQVAKRIRKVASNYQALVTDQIIEVAASGADVTVTLPTASQMRGQSLEIVLIDDAGGIGIVDGQGSEQISGQLTQEIDSKWGSVRVYSEGSAWRVY